MDRGALRGDPRPALLLALGLGALGVGARVALGTQAGGTGLDLLVAPAALALGVGLLRVDPAWPLSLAMVLTMFSGHWSLMSVAFPLDRAVMALAIVSALAVALRSPHASEFRLSAVHVVLAIAGLYAVGSAVWSATLTEHDAAFALLNRYALPLVLFAFGSVAFRSEHQRQILLVTLTGMGIYLAAESILSRTAPGLVLPHYIVDPSVGIHSDRARGPFTEAVANGMALFECAVAATILSVKRGSRRTRVVAALVVLACLVSVILTLTRSIWIGTALGCAVGVLAVPSARKYLPVAAACIVGLVAVALAVLPGLATDVHKRNNDQLPVWDRRNGNAAAVRIIEAHPLFGIGWDRFQARSSAFTRLGSDYPVTRTGLKEHNIFLATTAELGFVGAFGWVLALLLGVGGSILRRGPPELSAWRIGLIAIAAQWLVAANLTPLEYAFPNLLLWLWAGVAWPDRARVPEGAATSPAPDSQPGWTPARLPPLLPAAAFAGRHSPQFPASSPAAAAPVASALATARAAAGGTLPPRYSTSFDDLWRWEFDHAVAAILRPGMSVLDVGSGRRPAIAPSRRCPGVRYVGLDISGDELAAAPPGSYDEMVRADITTLTPALLGRFDLVVSLFLLEHVHPIDSALRNMRRYLRPDGLMVAQLGGGRSVRGMVNRTVSRALAVRLVHRLAPRSRKSLPASPYHRCTYHELEEMLDEWRDVDITPLFTGAQDFRRLGPLYAAYLGYEEWTFRRGRVDAAAWYLVRARR